MIPKLTKQKALIIVRLNTQRYNDNRYSAKKRTEFSSIIKYYKNRFNLTEKEIRGKKGKKWIIP